MRSAFKKAIVFILTLQARMVLRKYKPRIVAVTGSVGKTSTKDAIYAVLTPLGRVRKSEKSFNSEIGLPLAILGLSNAWSNPLRWLSNIVDGLSLIVFPAQYPEWLVLEVGADRPGDIRRVVEWLPVDIAVITRLPEVPVHVEYFDSPEEVVEEKAALIRALRPGGALVLYGDDERYAALASRLSALPAQAGASGLVTTFGFAPGCTVRGEDLQLLVDAAGFPEGMRADLLAGEEHVGVRVMGVAGAHALLPAIAAAATGLAAGRTLAQCAEALRAYEVPPGRMRLIPGMKGTLIIDDTYNASPAATLAALDTMALFPKKGKRVAVLGDMLELGRHSVVEHRKLGTRAAEIVDLLITVGFRARDIAEAALDEGLPEQNILQFEDIEKVGEALQGLLQEGDCVLVKGSQSMRMERIVEEVMVDPGRASELLVRQDAEWKKR